MGSCSSPSDAATRDEILDRYGVWDSTFDVEAELSDFTLLAARVCQAPMALVSFVGAEHVWFKSSIGLKLSGVPRDEAFCSHAINGADTFIVCDALSDKRFANSRLVALDPFVRFYAGVPLITAEGHALGTLCVLDHTRRSLGRGQRDGLHALARQLMRKLELRHAIALQQESAKAPVLEPDPAMAREEADADRDAITELPNQLSFRNRLAETLRRAEASDARPKDPASFCIMFVNVDRFRIINDTLGYEAGDQVLREAAQRLVSHASREDTVARFGSDEFALIVPRTNRTDSVDDYARHMLDALSLPFTVNAQELYLTASAGISAYPYDGKTAAALLKCAGIALTRAKTQNRNNYQLYTSGRTTRALKELVLENSLRRGLERGEFLLQYQPQVNIRSGHIVGMEALVRWQHPELGLVSPTEFIPLAEENGTIIPLGDWILRTACAQNRVWQETGFAPLRISINISARQFQQPHLVRSIADILNETELDPHSLDLELTESSIMANAEQAIRRLRELKAMGIQLSIDDFGTGYSSLNYLKRFPINTLKIDQSFVRDISTDPDDAAIVKAIITLAHSLKLNVIAEGVETEEQFTYLRLLRCDELQGFGYSRPLSAADVTPLLIERQQALNESGAHPHSWHMQPPGKREIEMTDARI